MPPPKKRSARFRHWWLPQLASGRSQRSVPLNASPRDQGPLLGKPLVLHAREPLVEHVEHPTAGGDQRWKAVVEFVASPPHRSGRPLEAPRGSDLGIVRNGIARRVVQKMGPFVDLFRPGLGGFPPRTTFTDHGNAQRPDDSEELCLWNAQRFIHDQKIDKVVGVGESLFLQHPHRHQTVGPVRLDLGLCGNHLRPVTVERLHDMSAARVKLQESRHVGGTQVDDDPCANTALIQQFRAVEIFCTVGGSRVARHTMRRRECGY